jgi:HAD superfamily hydrolase (TIGR01509 family)
VVKACLVDVYETILDPDLLPREQALAAFAGVDADDWLGEWLKTHTERDRGKLSVAASFAQTLEALGIEPKPELVDDLARKDAELMRQYCRLYDDTVPFLTELRAQGILIALVSNCGDTTRPLLEDLGVIPLADAVILSCEVGSAKPAREIYVSALEDLGVAATEAVMIDDQPSFCVGAEAVGVRAIQIARGDLNGQVSGAGFPVVHSLFDVTPLLLCSCGRLVNHDDRYTPARGRCRGRDRRARGSLLPQGPALSSHGP